MDAATVASLIGAAGGGAILLELTKRLLDALTGRGLKRRDEVDRAWSRADREARNRRIAEEHASRLRRMLIAAPCVAPEEIPDYPTYGHTSPTPTTKES
jgi:hypothetical protein